jgi:lipopolysaccharide export LptBFGC system permease protein LptF
MKKLALPFIIIAIIIGIYEQSKEKPNLYIIIAVIIVFMYSMMKLSAKTPSKYEDEIEDDNE